MRAFLMLGPDVVDPSYRRSLMIAFPYGMLQSHGLIYISLSLFLLSSFMSAFELRR